ncbi:MAG: tetratricopeptide repeat protein [Ignavibacteriae bacterium]|nr:tetratricopeptide repeat protein [Ignavibacteriota bacterium]
MKIKHFFILGISLSISTIFAQSTRGLVNDGVDAYEENKFADAETNFKKGIESNVESFESRFNLGDAIYKQGRFEESIEEFKNSFALAKTDEDKAKIFHNIGNSLLKAKKLKESIGAYRESLKLNPNDLETKYNLSYAIKQMQNQKNNQQNQNDQNQDQQNKDQQQNQDQQDQNKDQQDQKKNEDQKKEEQQNQQQKPEPKDEISKDEAQRILDALKNNEAELQKKMREQKVKKSNVEKDW